LYGTYQQGAQVQDQLDQYQQYVDERQPDFVGPKTPDSFYNF
jgi:hypothetical protein